MPQAWRLVKEHYASSAFSGEGAEKGGGRWNSRGLRAVYLSQSLSLAALETLVHLNPRLSFRYVFFTAKFPDSLVEAVAVLPPGWDVEPPGPPSQRLGDQWLREQRSAVLQVPSAIVPSELNYVLNPSHPDFGKIRISKPNPFAFDPRLLAYPGACK